VLHVQCRRDKYLLSMPGIEPLFHAFLVRILVLCRSDRPGSFRLQLRDIPVTVRGLGGYYQGCFCDSNKSHRGYCGRQRPESKNVSATVRFRIMKAELSGSHHMSHY
jgi:hypothetical protein